jgi:ubiquinone/menaquinone biosynthesis C-methylase UbiE
MLMYDQLELRPGLHILDVGCGPGFPLLELAQTYGSSCRFTGVDIWKEVLDRAFQKLAFYELDHARLVRADGAHLPFRSSEFDLILSNLGVNNFGDAASALRECSRVSKPEGRIALTTNVKGHMQEFYDLFRETLRELGSEDSLERLSQNEDHRGTKESLGTLLGDAGFEIVKTVEDSFQLRYLNGRALLEHSLVRYGFLDGWRAVVVDDDEVRVFTMLESKLDDLAHRRGELSMSVPMLYVEGRKI